MDEHFPVETTVRIPGRPNIRLRPEAVDELLLLVVGARVYFGQDMPEARPDGTPRSLHAAVGRAVGATRCADDDRRLEVSLILNEAMREFVPLLALDGPLMVGIDMTATDVEPDPDGVGADVGKVVHVRSLSIVPR